MVNNNINLKEGEKERDREKRENINKITKFTQWIWGNIIFYEQQFQTLLHLIKKKVYILNKKILQHFTCVYINYNFLYFYLY